MSKQEEEQQQTWHWRNTMKPVRFFIFDARAGLFVVILLVHFRLWTLYLFLTMLGIFNLLERKGLSFAAAMRAMRAWIIGPYRPGWLWIRKRPLHDSGSE